jgi:hypothetical protein
MLPLALQVILPHAQRNMQHSQWATTLDSGSSAERDEVWVCSICFFTLTLPRHEITSNKNHFTDHRVSFWIGFAVFETVRFHWLNNLWGSICFSCIIFEVLLVCGSWKGSIVNISYREQLLGAGLAPSNCIRSWNLGCSIIYFKVQECT